MSESINVCKSRVAEIIQQELHKNFQEEKEDKEEDEFEGNIEKMEEAEKNLINEINIEEKNFRIEINEEAQIIKNINEEIKKVMAYLNGKGTEENVSYIKGLLNKLGKKSLLLNYAVMRNDLDEIKKHITDIKIDETEKIEMLAKLNDKAISDKIIGLIATEEANIPQKPPLGKRKTSHSEYGTTSYNQDYEKMDDLCCSYQNAINEYNKHCISILGIALTAKNQHLASRAVSKVKTNIDYTSEYLGDNAYMWTVRNDNSDIEKAKATYNEAVRNGAFK